jgi:hypothetical protein
MNKLGKINTINKKFTKAAILLIIVVVFASLYCHICLNDLKGLKKVSYSVPVFSYPMKQITYMTSSFGEFRGGHFHAGIDISTLRQTGWDVISPVDGYIYKVKTSYYGYGKVIYLRTIDDNYTVLLAHLSGFAPEVERLIREKQISSGKYSQDICFEKNEHVVSKGQVIAFSGDTGSGGPHLHYEIRDANQNPIKFAVRELMEQDVTEPVVHSIAVRPMNKGSMVDGECKTKVYRMRKDPLTGFFIPEKNITVRGEIVLSLYAYDEEYSNKIGVNRVDLVREDGESFTVDISTFSPEMSRKTFSAYSREAYGKNGTGFLNLFQDNNGQLPFYSENKNSVFLIEDKPENITIHAYDSGGNKCTAKIVLIPCSSDTGKYAQNRFFSLNKM